MTTNEMMLAKAFRENAGLEQTKAEALATTLFDAIRDNVVTKGDLTVLAASMRADLARVEAATKSDLDKLGAAMKADLTRVEAGSNLRFEKLERQIDRMVVRLGALVVVVAGLLLGALHYWPPPHT